MSRISVINKETGDTLFKAQDYNGKVAIPGFKGKTHMNPLLKNITTVDELIDYLSYFSDRVLVKDDGIGIDKEDTQAQVGMPAPTGTGHERIASEEVNSRVIPALKILEDILKRVETKKKDRAEMQAHSEALNLELQGARAIVPMDGQFYVTMDGDGIGNQVAQAQYTNDEKKVKEVSQKIESGKDLFIQWGTGYAGVVIEAGGDEGQVRVPAAALEHIEEFRTNYLKQVGATVTVGVGRSISESIQARELGKLRGKNQVVYFDDGTKKELELRLEKKGTETPEKKLNESGVLKSPNETTKLGQNIADKDPQKKEQNLRDQKAELS